MEPDSCDVIMPVEIHDDDIRHALSELRSLHAGEAGVISAAACGSRAIPALRTLLFERDRSGLFQVRCRAVEALAQLSAYGVLGEFLTSHVESADPVERMGDDAVINVAAIALGQLRSEHTFHLLTELTEKRVMPGVIKALGAFHREETIPLLIAALEDDDCRAPAEAALRRLGIDARDALLVALSPASSDGESESRLRALRSVLRLLSFIPTTRQGWHRLKHLIDHRDHKIAILVCEICLTNSETSEKRRAVCRLIDLLTCTDWMLTEEIENSLADHYDIAKGPISDRRSLSDMKRRGDEDRLSEALHRVQKYAAVRRSNRSMS
jgi:hypothetical protein